MDKDFYKKLTLAVYRVTELLPEEEPLKRQIRELANKVLANFILTNPSANNLNIKRDLFRNIKILDSYFELAEAQNWIDSRNFLVLRREYNKMQKLLENRLALTEPTAPQGTNTGKPVEKFFSKSVLHRNSTQKRQERIFEAIKANGKIKVGDLIKIFPEVNRRTLIRDLEGFSRTGFIERNGSGRGTCYITKNMT